MTTIFRPGQREIAPNFGFGNLLRLPTIQTSALKRSSGVQVMRAETMPTHQRFVPTCILLLGRRGEGKTLTMTAIGYFMHRAYFRAGRRRRVMANYQVNFADYLDPRLIDWLNNYPPAGHDALCLVDEISAYAPGRRSLARVNVDLAEFLRQIRKRRIEFIFTTQFPQVLDQQILMQIDLFVQVHLRHGGCGAPLHRYCVDLTVYDWWGQWTGNMMLRRWPPTPMESDWELTLHNCHNVFDQFNSNEVVAPIWSKSRDAIVHEVWGDREPGARAAISEMESQASDSEGVADSETQLLRILQDKVKVGFLLRPLLNQANHQVPTIVTVENFRDWLVLKGFTVVQNGRVWEVEGTQ